MFMSISDGRQVQEKTYEEELKSPYWLLRSLTGLSANAFAKKIGVSHTYFADLEKGQRGNPSQSVRHRIATVVGVSDATVDYLVLKNHQKTNEIHAFLLRILDDCVQEMRQVNDDNFLFHL